MAIVRGLITLDEMRQSVYGNKQAATADTTNDADFEAYISAATPYIEDGPEGTGPMFAETRSLTLNGGTGCLVLPFRFNAVTSLTVDGTATTAFTANETAGLIYAGSTSGGGWFNTGHQNVVVEVTVGYDVIPPNVVLATRELCRLWWQNGRQAPGPNSGVNGPDVSALTPGILGRVRALLSPSPDLPGFA